MSSGTRLLLVIACGCLLLAGTCVAAVGWMFYGPGALVVQVHEQDRDGGRTDVALRIPGVVVKTVLALVPREALAEGSAEAREVLPAALAAVGSLESMPDATLVEVERPGERVEVAKRGSTLRVYVTEQGESVRIEVPIRYARWILEQLAAAAPAPAREKV